MVYYETINKGNRKASCKQRKEEQMMKTMDMIKNAVLGIISVLVALAELPETPIMAIALTLIADGILHPMKAYMLSAVICSVLAVLSAIATLRNLSGYRGAMRWACLLISGFLMLNMATNVSWLRRHSNQENTPVPTAYTVPVYSPNQVAYQPREAKSTGMQCFFCEPGRVGKCDNCDGDGRYEALEDSIWGSRCRECDGSGVCNGCKGDGIMGN